MPNPRCCRLDHLGPRSPRSPPRPSACPWRDRRDHQQQWVDHVDPAGREELSPDSLEMITAAAVRIDDETAGLDRQRGSVGDVGSCWKSGEDDRLIVPDPILPSRVLCRLCPTQHLMIVAASHTTTRWNSLQLSAGRHRCPPRTDLKIRSPTGHGGSSPPAGSSLATFSFWQGWPPSHPAQGAVRDDLASAWAADDGRPERAVPVAGAVPP
jgi:hypothetical protein